MAKDTEKMTPASGENQPRVLELIDKLTETA
jgi:hypothetical protein